MLIVTLKMTVPALLRALLGLTIRSSSVLELIWVVLNMQKGKN
ncbi:unnamed protein product [Linum tenue]|uniref:Uncharacterized protein n=1 Tax=Linum tenue TaxID=586396 RepID=A0AAV0PHE5_9ROSI|nr:unnamed protein product [Linum tenue]